MAYTKQTWVDRVVEFARRFKVAEAGGYSTLTPEPGTITAAGTPVDASRLNHMEDGIEAANYGCPVGEVKVWPAAAAPTKYLLCDGTAISRTTYADLFALIGTTYGAGDSSTTFNLPNLKGKVVVGYNAAETEFDALGETGGEKTHALTEAEMKSHTHTIPTNYTASTSHAHYSADAYVTTGINGGTVGVILALTYSGGDQAHNNLQPYIAMNYIIRALA